MKKIFSLMMVAGLTLTGCDLFGSDDDDAPAVPELKGSFGEVMTDTVFNISGEFQGAFDLIEGVKVSASVSPETKDLIDNGELEGGDFSEEFSAEFISGNGAEFAVIDVAEDATAKEIMELTATVETSESTGVLSAGDVVAVTLGDDRLGEDVYDFYVLTIKEVVSDADSELGVTPAENEGYIVFEYKLLDVDEEAADAYFAYMLEQLGEELVEEEMVEE